MRIPIKKENKMDGVGQWDGKKEKRRKMGGQGVIGWIRTTTTTRRERATVRYAGTLHMSWNYDDKRKQKTV